jgi:hypothetical protein
LYRAKSGGRNQVASWDPEIQFQVTNVQIHNKLLKRKEPIKRMA